MSKIEAVFSNIERRIKGLVKQIRLKDYGEDAVNRIQKRTRLGYGVENGKRGAPRYKLPKLSEPYKKQRKKKKLDSSTSASKSNLTLTGQLLRSLISKVTGRKIILTITENRTDGIKNSDLVKWQSEKGRDFFELTDKEVKGLRNQLKKDLIKLIKKR
jgi:hypothetical protein